jgi:pimeloyl-ACP methyl ester carboxylesterase
MPKPYDAKKPTLVLVNSLTTSSELFRPQYADDRLTSAVNLIAIEPLGHGKTRTKRPTWTFWDTGRHSHPKLAKTFKLIKQMQR